MTRLLIIFFLLLSKLSLATTVKGTISSESGETLPFTSVYIKGTTIGTTSNSEGNFSLSLNPGNYELAVKYIGYQIHFEKIVVTSEPLVLKIKLKPDNITLREVTVKANGEDPAYDIIRNAQKKRQYYLDLVKSYSCDVYIKGLQRIKKYPTKFFGQNITAATLDIIDSTSGIVYLSESVSKFHFQKPDNIREEMIASKVSGENKAFSYNQASQLLFNFYENLIPVSILSKQKFISPISSMAMLYYRFKLLGSFEENGISIFKIQVKPINPSGPCFGGVIYITDQTYRIHSTNLYLTKNAGIFLVDTLSIKQVQAPVTGDIWMPISSQYDFIFSFLGFKGDGTYLNNSTNFEVNKDFGKNFFSSEILTVNKESNKKDSSFWNNYRPVPLTKEESKDYVARDSAFTIHHSKAYQDSLDKKDNKFNFGNIFFGYSYSRTHENQILSFQPLVSSLEFNTVEGLSIYLKTKYYRSKDERNTFKQWEPTIRYGFSNKRWNASLKFLNYYNAVKKSQFSVEAGIATMQLNNKEPISPLFNTISTLLFEENYLKLYQKRYASAFYSTELTNGILFRSDIEYAQRFPLQNTSNFKLVNFPNKEYMNNEPEGFTIKQSDILTLSALFRIRFKQRYINRPDEKIILGSKYPAFTIGVKQGISTKSGSSINYTFVKLSVDDEISLGILGNAHYRATAGKFILKDDLQYLDFAHFTGNRLFITDFQFDRFCNLDYYANSSSDYFLEGHFELNTGGIIMGKMPIFKKLRTKEIFSVHYLKTERLNNYLELGIGLQKGVTPFRLQYVISFTEQQKSFHGFRLAIPFNFN